MALDFSEPLVSPLGRGAVTKGSAGPPRSVFNQDVECRTLGKPMAALLQVALLRRRSLSVQGNPLRT